MTEKGCDNCYYTYFDERAYPCSLCIRGIERTDQWQPGKKTKAEQTEPNSSEIPNNCEEQAIRCPKCGRTDYIRDMEKDMGIKDSHYKYKCVNCNTYIKTEPTISKMEQVEDEPQTEDGIMPEVKAEVRLDENNKTLWIKTDTIESFDRIITEDGSNWCRIFYEECGECAHNKPRSNDEPQTDNGIGCSRCEGRYDCYDRDMPHAVHCNNYGKITDEPQTDCLWR